MHLAPDDIVLAMFGFLHTGPHGLTDAFGGILYNSRNVETKSSRYTRNVIVNQYRSASSSCHSLLRHFGTDNPRGGVIRFALVDFPHLIIS